jgi:cholesterol oxidase
VTDLQRPAPRAHILSGVGSAWTTGGDGSAREYDYDWIVIGSGFGGSVSALRLSEKGYRVGVLESGRRFEDDDYAKSAWSFRRFIWLPQLGMRGIMRFFVFKDVVILAGCGVGGGSLVYANTLYVPPRDFFRSPEWAGLQDWQTALAPHYDEAKRMLGATPVAFDTDADRLLREVGEAMGVADTYGRPTVGVFFGEPGVTVPDPYFGGEGPRRAGCIRCGACMVGCRFNAKNTLVKNYLYLAERKGTEIHPERTVLDVQPLRAEDGSDGYAVTAVRSGSWVRRDRTTLTARGVVFSAGAVGTNILLRRCKAAGSLSRISERLGEVVRTNSEALLAVTATEDRYDFADSIAITSSIYPDEFTHIENVTYGRAGDAMSVLFTMLTGAGTRVTRPLRWLAEIFKSPRKAIRLVLPNKWSQRTMILLVMQTLNNHMRLRPVGTGRKGLLQTEQDRDNPNPTYIAAANEAAEILAQKMGGIAQSNLPEALFNTPATAHILGGAIIAPDPQRGVVDMHQRVFGYENLMVCDGSVVPANPGVNPSLTITALAEHAMTHVAPRAVGADGAPAAPQDSPIG